MFIIVILRLFLVLKWLLQVVGILVPIFVFWEPQSKELIAVISAVFLIIPELVMGTILWISKGVSSVYNTKNPEHVRISVPVFDEKSIQASFWGYMLILTSFSMSVGSLLGISVLSAGISALACFAWKGSLKKIFRKYLEVNA